MDETGKSPSCGSDSDLIGDLDAGLQQDVGELRVRFCCHPQSEVWVGLYGVDHLYTESSLSQ